MRAPAPVYTIPLGLSQPSCSRCSSSEASACKPTDTMPESRQARWVTIQSTECAPTCAIRWPRRSPADSNWRAWATAAAITSPHVHSHGNPRFDWLPRLDWLPRTSTTARWSNASSSRASKRSTNDSTAGPPWSGRPSSRACARAEAVVSVMVPPVQKARQSPGPSRYTSWQGRVLRACLPWHE